MLKTKPIYLLLLPVFFVLHGFLENFGFVSGKDALVLCLSYVLLTFSIAFFSYIFFRNWTKAAMITVIWMSFFFFFGAVHEFLRDNIPVRFFSRYSFLLAFVFLLLIVIFILLKKTRKPLYRTTYFLNSLFLIYIIVDSVGVLIKTFGPQDEGLSIYRFAGSNNYNICDTCKKPNIYFLLMDEYTSTLGLKQMFNFDNDLDSFLIDKGFSVQARSRSNYNFTSFSMSATLNMNFIEGIKNVKAVTADDYAYCNKLVRDNEVIKFLDANGYDIVNYSVFDLAGHPSTVDQSFLPLKTKLITDRTLFARMNEDVGWLLMTYWPFKLFRRNYVLQHRDNNEDFIRLVKESAKTKTNKPRFVYAHLYMPHSPYYYDKNGNLKSNETIFSEMHTKPPASYIEYVQYTNTRIVEMVNSLQQDDPNAIIILLGDHGNRKKAVGPYPIHVFRNLNAVYFPDKDYSKLYDSITNINMFRVIFNKQFNQQLELQKDTSIYLMDKKPKPLTP
jgi:hypothetical protein